MRLPSHAEYPPSYDEPDALLRCQRCDCEFDTADDRIEYCAACVAVLDAPADIDESLIPF